MSIKRRSTSPSLTGNRQRPSAVAYGRSRRPSRSTPSVENSSPSPRGGGPSEPTQVANPSAAAKPAVHPIARMSRLVLIAGSPPRLPALDFDHAGSGPAETIRPVHVLHICLRQHVAARRNSAHHIGHAEHRLVARAALEGGAEPVIAKLRVFRLHRVFDPRQSSGVAGGYEPRVVDLE